MEANEYQLLAARTLIDKPDFELSDEDHQVLYDVLALEALLGLVTEHVKKGILHQHGFKRGEYNALLRSLVQVAMAAMEDHTPLRHIPDELIMVAWNIIGLNGEAAEVADTFLSSIESNERLDLRKELGDCSWYVSGTATKLGYTLADLLQYNIAKLLARYPDGYTSKDSQVRVDTVRRGDA